MPTSPPSAPAPSGAGTGKSVKVEHGWIELQTDKGAQAVEHQFWVRHEIFIADEQDVWSIFFAQVYFRLA